jgi:hypothetical protein
MILEENIGGVVCTIIRENGQTTELSVGDYFSDHERSTLTVVGTGKIVVRVDPNCTVEIRGVEAETEAAPVEAAPAPVEVVVEDKVAATEATVIVNPKAKA